MRWMMGNNKQRALQQKILFLVRAVQLLKLAKIVARYELARARPAEQAVD